MYDIMECEGGLWIYVTTLCQMYDRRGHFYTMIKNFTHHTYRAKWTRSNSDQTRLDCLLQGSKVSRALLVQRAVRCRFFKYCTSQEMLTKPIPCHPSEREQTPKEYSCQGVKSDFPFSVTEKGQVSLKRCPGGIIEKTNYPSNTPTQRQRM